MYNLTTVLAALRLSQSLVNPSPAAASSELQSGFKAVNASAKGHAADCRVEPYDVPVQVPAFQPYEETKANVYRYRQQQGVNLGSLYVIYYLNDMLSSTNGLYSSQIRPRTVDDSLSL